MITSLELTDFKAFHQQTIKLAPLTIVLGPNNCGKSSLIAPLRLLAQTVQAGEPKLGLLLDGALGDFGTFRDIVHGNYRGRPMRLQLSALDERFPELGEATIDVEFKYRTQRRELVIREATLKLRGKHLVTGSLSSDSQRLVITRLAGRAVPAAQRSGISDALRFSNFIPQLWPQTDKSSKSDTTGPLWDTVRELEDPADQAFYVLRRALSGVEYLSAMRQPPERTYHQTGASRPRLGTYGDNWAGMFVSDASLAARNRRILPGINAWLKQAGLASDVRLNWLSDRHYEVQVKHPQTREYQNLADVGQANSQVLPVLVGGLRLLPGSTYIVEEPEIHLHPAAQADLADFFVGLHEHGVRSIVETHSEYLVVRLQQHVASGRLSADDVRFIYVDATPSRKRARTLKLDDHARFTKPLAGGFFPQRMEEAKELARLRAKGN